MLPYAPDAWYVPSSVKTGYEISFTRYFYKPQPLRSLEEIRADILGLEGETEGLLGEIVGGGVEASGSPLPSRLGFMAGQIEVPDDFDTMGGPEIENPFGTTA